jgi:hypothetical protein
VLRDVRESPAKKLKCVWVQYMQREVTKLLPRALGVNKPMTNCVLDLNNKYRGKGLVCVIDRPISNWG